MRLNNIKKILIIVLLVLGTLVFQGANSCLKTEPSVSRIDISYVPFDVTTIVNVNCDTFLSGFKEIKKKKTLIDSVQKKEFMDIVNNLDSINNAERPIMDTRATIDVIKSNGEVLHFCIDRFYTILNDSIYFKTSEELRNIIER